MKGFSWITKRELKNKPSNETLTKGVKNAGFPPIRKQIGFCDTSYRGIRTLPESQHFSHPQPLAIIIIMRNFLFFAFLIISSLVYCQNNLNSDGWRTIIESRSISNNSQKVFIDFLKPKLYGGTFEYDTSYRLNSSIFLSLLNIKEPEFSFKPKEIEVFFLLFDNEYNLIDFKSRKLTYSIIPDGGYVSINSEVKYHNNMIEVIEKSNSSKSPEIELSPKENFINKNKISYIIENGKKNQAKKVVIESESYVIDK
jgi:hypothetical protein